MVLRVNAPKIQHVGIQMHDHEEIRNKEKKDENIGNKENAVSSGLSLG